MECQDGVSCSEMEVVCYFPPSVLGRILKKKERVQGFGRNTFILFLKDKIPVSAYNSPKPPFPPKPSRAVVATMRWG